MLQPLPLLLLRLLMKTNSDHCAFRLHTGMHDTSFRRRTASRTFYVRKGVGSPSNKVNI